MQTASMPISMTIRDVPEATRDELAARARRSGRSLQEYVRAHLIEAAARPDVDDVLRRAEARVRAAGSEVPAEAILHAVDEDRR